METAFFISDAAFGFEALIFIVTIVFLVFQIHKNGHASRSLWWFVMATALTGMVAFLFSVHYVINDPHDKSWAIFVVLTILLPLILVIIINSKRNIR